MELPAHGVASREIVHTARGGYEIGGDLFTADESRAKHFHSVRPHGLSAQQTRPLQSDNFKSPIRRRKPARSSGRDVTSFVKMRARQSRAASFAKGLDSLSVFAPPALNPDSPLRQGADPEGTLVLSPVDLDDCEDDSRWRNGNLLHELAGRAALRASAHLVKSKAGMLARSPSRVDPVDQDLLSVASLGMLSSFSKLHD